MGRTYVAYVTDKSHGVNFMPWITLVAITLFMHEEYLTTADIAKEMVSAKSENYNSVYSAVHSAITKLKEMKCLHIETNSVGRPAYILNNKGLNMFQKQINAYDASVKFTKYTDSKLLK